ncbi:hypothetical protein ACFLWC_06180 [Chloroflexota bacterium]
MAEPKYGKYIIKPPKTEGGFGSFIASMWQVDKEKEAYSSNALIRFRWISEPFVMESGNPHAHDFDQYLCFYGGNPKDVGDFGAEVEISLGKEGEKHTFDSATIVYIPKGLVHAPLNFKIVDKPIVFIGIALTSEYAQIRKK